jgi:hypothetical protein
MRQEMIRMHKKVEEWNEIKAGFNEQWAAMPEQRKDAVKSLAIGIPIGLAAAHWFVVPFANGMMSLFGIKPTPAITIMTYVIMALCTSGIIAGTIIKNKAMRNAAYK